MSGRERRVSPRKDCAILLRFRVLANGNGHRAVAGPITASPEPQASRMDAHFATLVGEATNLSERGIYFTSSEKIRTGQPLEMYFIIPRELTGRRAEDVRCSARIVHMDSGPDREGRAGVGAVIGHFDALPAPHNWNN